MPVLYANNAASRLSASITNTATSFSVTSATGALFPSISGGDYFYVTLMDTAGNLEVVKVTARATDTFTVVRGQDGTTARAYSVNDIVELRITKVMLDDFKTDTRTGYAPLSGATFTGGLLIPAGTVTAPSLAFSDDTNTGLYRSATDTLAITAGGVQSATFDSSGNARIIGNLGVKSASVSSSAAINSSISLSSDATRYGMLNLLAITSQTLTADRIHSAAYNRVDSYDQNSTAFQTSAYGAWNEARAVRSTINLGGGNSVDGEGQLVGAYNASTLSTSDSTFNRVENMHGSYNLTQVTGGSVSLSVATTSGSTTATINGSGQTTAMIRVGDFITNNSAVPAGATVATIVDATTFTISAAATITQTDSSTTFAFATSYADNAYGSTAIVQASYTGATINAAYGFASTVRPTATGATINTGYLFYGTNSTVTGTFTNRYGLYIASAINNYVAGGFQIGGTALGGTSGAGLGVGAQPSGTAGTITMSGQLTNTVAVGTAPFVITSTTRVANLNVATAGNADTVTNGVYTTGDQQITGIKNFLVNTNSAIATASSNLATLEVRSPGTGAGAGAAFMQFHRPSAHAAYFGIDTDNVWKVGGWSMGANAYPILHSNNYNSYAPTLTGTGASGTWGISVTGSAATLTTGRTVGMTGDVTWTSGSFNGSADVTGAATLANSGVTAGTYGSSTNIPQLTVDAKGRVTSVSNVAVSIPSGSLTFTGDVTGSGTTGSSTALTLANSGVAAGSYGGNNSIPSVTVDAKGRVTAASTVTPSGTWGISITGSAASATGNAGTATTLQTARTLTVGATGKTFNGSANVSWTLTEIAAGGTITTSGSASSLILSDTGTNGANLRLVGSGATTPNKTIRAQLGKFQVINSGYTNFCFEATDAGDFTALGNVTAYSDERLKKDWAELPDDFIERLAGVKHGTYTRIDNGMRQIGVSAQSLQSVSPEGVIDGDYLSVSYGNVALAAAVELAKKVVEQERRIERLEALVEKLIGY